MDELTPPFRVKTTAVYETVVDAEDSIVCFISIRERSRQVAELIAGLLNENLGNKE